MLDVQAAIRAAGLPGYRAAYRQAENADVPPVYVVYALSMEANAYFDDMPHTMIHKPTLHLVSTHDPEPAMQALYQAMAEEGFYCAEHQDGYDRDADAYVMVSQWQGVETL